MRAILALEGARALAWLVESHDAFVRGRDLRLLIDRVNDPAFGALWDIGNSFMLGGELPQATLAALGPYVGGVHLKDAVREAARTPGAQDSWRYVPPGTGEIPLAEGLRLLQAQAYGGWLVFEHEKRWHPQLPEPEEALPQFADWIRALR
jgi:sugar phosphate isomerase/epimerase